MRICIDCRAASHPQRGGYKTYTENLLLGLSQVDKTHKYVLFLDRDIGDRDLCRPMHSSIGIVSNHLPIVGAAAREQISLRKAALASGCDLAHFPCNTGPLSYKGRYVVTVHDLTTIVDACSLLGSGSFGTTWRCLIAKYTGLLIPRLAAGAAAIITVSSYARKEIIECLGIPSEKVFTTPLAPSPSYHPLEEQALVSARTKLKHSYGIQKPYILAIGERPLKNITGLLRAFNRVDNTLRSTHVVVVAVAAQAYRPELEREIRSLGLEEKVILLGSQPAQKLLLLYNCAELLAFPSLRESFGLPVVEAMACGTPVVTSRTAALPETAGGAAILIDPYDTSAMAEALERVLRNEELREELRRAGLTRASQLSWKKTAEETVRVYEHALQVPIG